MDKDEHNHFHGYQDKKDAFNKELDELATRIHKEMWLSSHSILEAIPETLGESMDYASIVKHCYRNNSATLLGAVTLDLIDIHLSTLADESAENELT